MAAINIYVQVSVCTYIVISLGTIPRSGTAGSYGDSMFIILRKCQTVSQIDASFYFLTRAIYRSQLFPFLANTSYLIFFSILVILVDWSYISLEFWFAFPWWLVLLSTFSLMHWPLVYLLWKNIYSDLFPIF